MSAIIRRKSIVMKAVVIALAVMSLVGTLAISASAVAPVAPYFYLDNEFQYLPPMGNDTVADIEYYILNDMYMYFFKPETWTNPSNNHTYIGEITSFRVYDQFSGAYFETQHGGVATVSSLYRQYNDDNQDYYQFKIQVDLFDITAGTPVQHIEVDVYIPGTKLP
jgi:hypothetical protein